MRIHGYVYRPAIPSARQQRSSLLLEKIWHCKDWYMDGTLDICPTMFSQLYTIHGRRNNQHFPLVYALACKKDYFTYKGILNQLKLAEPRLQPTKIMIDFENYIVSIGLVDILARRCMKVREAVENYQGVVLSLLGTLGLLTKIAELCPKAPDTTKFLASIKSTDLFGTISLLYSTIVPVGECIPPRTISLAAAIFNLLVTVANLDLAAFQEVLGDETLSFQFFDVIVILLTYCGTELLSSGGPKSTEKNETQAVVVDLVATLGFYCANNKKNQNRITSEQWTLVIKNLAKLPTQFEIVVYPTLVTIITDNPEAQEVIGREFDLKFLDEYRNSDLGKKNMLISILKSSDANSNSNKKIKNQTSA
ncbi:S phase cyclin A-associated protein in the endoplasmic reticulum [Pseudolycoriella hygida]|uniref:S phase cyclin A-associated protein in the endoplasmic reticulum n=1 Tax=Pseudolycoriella hygida TaxID=35572 RepID=A0A9Q0N937_9DIPT|nr:S phase cyclin A-associated protein in the endoplasmic reticulum [Pseudolycoriella hygida]